MQQPPWSCAGVSGGQESRERDKGVKEGDPLHSCGSTGAETAHRRDIQIHTAEEYHEQLGSGAHGHVVGSAGPGRAAASWSTQRSVLWRLEAPFGRQRHQSIIVTRIVSESWLARIVFAVTHVGRSTWDCIPNALTRWRIIIDRSAIDAEAGARAAGQERRKNKGGRKHKAL